VNYVTEWVNLIEWVGYKSEAEAASVQCSLIADKKKKKFKILRL
jgi:hypothetical protein